MSTYTLYPQSQEDYRWTIRGGVHGQRWIIHCLMCPYDSEATDLFPAQVDYLTHWRERHVHW